MCRRKDMRKGLSEGCNKGVGSVFDRGCVKG